MKKKLFKFLIMIILIIIIFYICIESIKSSKPKSDISTIYGIEGIKNIPFKFQIEYKIFKELFILNGNIGTKPVSIQDKSLIHLVLETIKHTCQK